MADAETNPTVEKLLAMMERLAAPKPTEVHVHIDLGQLMKALDKRKKKADVMEAPSAKESPTGWLPHPG